MSGSIQRNRKIERIFDLFKNRYNIQPRMLNKLKEVYPNLTNLKENNKSLYLYGKPGTGKSIYALGVVAQALTNIKVPIMDNSFSFVAISELLVNLKNYFTKIKANPKYGIKYDNNEMFTYEEQLINKCKFCNYLVLDDYGIGSHTQWSNEVLLSIIDYRYNQEKDIIITTNLTMNELASSTGDDRIVSRLADMCKVILFKTQYRKT